METYRVDVKSILEVLGETIEVSDTLPSNSLDVGDEHFGLRAPISFQVSLTNGGTGVVAMGTAVAEVTATCARCLVEFPLTIEAGVEGYYVRPGDVDNIPEEQEVEEIDADGYVDILPAIMSAIILEAPFAPLHADDCAGLCSSCGADLNTEDCSCVGGPNPDSPMAVLRTLIQEDPPSLA
jgi:uncharacterized protein